MNKLEERIWTAICDEGANRLKRNELYSEADKAKIAAEICLEIADKSFDAGGNYMLACEMEIIPNPYKDKEQYLSELSGNTEQLKEPKTT